MEARYLRVHYFSRAAYEVSIAQWQGQRLLDVFTAAAAPYSDEKSRKGYGKAVLEQLESITNIVNPFAQPEKKTRRKLTEEERMEFLKNANATGTGGLNGLMQAVSEAAKQLSKAE